MEYKIKVISQQSIKTSYELSSKFKITIDGIPVTGIRHIKGLKKEPKVSFGHAGQFIYVLQLDNKLIKRQKDFKDLRIAIIKALEGKVNWSDADRQYRKGINERANSKKQQGNRKGLVQSGDKDLISEV